MAAALGGQLEGWNLHPEHFAERHGLIVIIALGETLIVAAAGLVGGPKTATALGTGALAVAVTCGLWWSYFRHTRGVLERALASSEGNDQTRLARDTYSAIHFPMLSGIVAMAAVGEMALMHPEDPLALGARIAIGLGAVLFVCGTAAALWRTTGRPYVWRWLIMPGAALAVILIGRAPWLTLSLIMMALVAIALIEHAAAPNRTAA